MMRQSMMQQEHPQQQIKNQQQQQQLQPQTMQQQQMLQPQQQPGLEVVVTCNQDGEEESQIDSLISKLDTRDRNRIMKAILMLSS